MLDDKKMTTYCHRQISVFFVKLLDVSEEDFVFKGRTYSWRDVKDVEVTRGSVLLNAFMFPAGTAKAKVTLKDDTHLQINGRSIERSDKAPRIDKITGESDAFLELIELFQKERRIT